jgi:hypothetical protein
MLHDYTKVSAGSLATIIMDGADPTSLVNLLYAPPPMPYDTMYRFAIQQGEVQNRSGGSEAFAGIGARLHKRRWKFGLWTDATTTYTDKTTQAQEVATTDDVPLETTTNNDGFVAAALDKFNCINLSVSTASVGAPVRTFEYTKADGTWGSVAIATMYVGPPSGAQYVTTGSKENAIAFEPPLDWGLAVAAHGTNIPVGYYCVRVRATTAPGTAGLAKSVTIAMLLLGVAGLGNTLLLTVAQGSGEHCFSCLADGIVAFNATPAAQNVFRVNVRSMG